MTRGESSVSNSSEKCELTNDKLVATLNDILDVLEERIDNYLVQIKPHPYQDVDVIKKTINNRKNVNIVYDMPAILSRNSDVVIATYTSSVLDAMVLGKPCIECYDENEFFLRNFPAGSMFEKIGGLRVRNKIEFTSALDFALSNKNFSYDFGTISSGFDFGSIFY